MSRPIPPNYDQAMLLPACLEDWVSARHPARFVRDFVATLDLRALGFRDSPGVRARPHLAFEMLLAVWLFGWMDRTRSLRRLDKACMECMPYIWLSGNLQPDHNTLWRFFRDNKAQLRKLFKRIVQVADEAALIDSTIAAVEQEAAMDEPAYATAEQMQDAKQRRDTIRQALNAVERAAAEHLHPTEPEAQRMKARQGTRPGCNAQIAVDHDSDLIVAASVVQDQNDTAQWALACSAYNLRKMYAFWLQGELNLAGCCVAQGGHLVRRNRSPGAVDRS
jgi:transposase